MKTVQTAARYFPEHCGGIQVHLSELIHAMRAYGVESQVAAPKFSAHEDIYRHDDIDVFRYPVIGSLKLEPNHGHTPHRGFDRFVNWLRQQDAEVYHQHQWAPACGLPHLRAAKELGMATVVTIHLPTPICLRDTLMLNGQSVCNGRIDPVRCSRCCGVSEHLSAPTIQLLSRLPIPMSQAARGALRRSHRLAPSLRTSAEALLSPLTIPAFVTARRNSLLEMARWSDRIIAVCQWLYDALLLNGVPERKLMLCRCGVSKHLHKPATREPSKRSFRVGFLGRWNPTKGIHVLVDAIRRMPAECAIELVIHGVADDEHYRQQVLSRIGRDPRIHIAPPVERADLPAVLPSFDVLAVPSQWLETGPLVVLEAHASGVPVIGSDLGGIAELVQPNVNGLLVPPGDSTDWAAALTRLVENPALLDKLRRGIRPVRSISAEAAELAALYKGLSSDRFAHSRKEAQLYS